MPEERMLERRRFCQLGALATGSLILPVVGQAQPVEVPVPEGNRAGLESAPRRPGANNVEVDGRTLFEALKADSPEAGMGFFIPQDVFRAVKGISDPDALHARMIRLFERDVHELHAELGEDADDAEFVRFEFSRRRGWVGLREESNRLPYWAQRHNWLHYTVGEQERRFEVRTMISWGDHWYITHLSEFRR
ncbi:MAG: hypothetical protein ACI9KE_005724 [Polyangiales bacterium]|jgi:hypothetical protein